MFLWLAVVDITATNLYAVPNQYSSPPATDSSYFHFSHRMSALHIFNFLSGEPCIRTVFTIGGLASFYSTPCETYPSVTDSKFISKTKTNSVPWSEL